MTKTLLASVAVLSLALAGCASEDKMMKDAGVGNAASPNEASSISSGAGEGAVSGGSVATTPVTYSAPPRVNGVGSAAGPNEPSAVSSGAGEGGSNDSMMSLCNSKGGVVGEWPGSDGATKTCRAADGSEYPLASLSSYEAFQ